MFEARATAMEFLDLPDCDPSLAAASYRFMETVNYRFGGIRLVDDHHRHDALGEDPVDHGVCHPLTPAFRRRQAPSGASQPV